MSSQIVREGRGPADSKSQFFQPHHASPQHFTHVSLVITNDEWNTNLGQVSGSPLLHPTRLPPELLKITNMQPGPHTQKVPGHNCFRVMENEKMEKKKNNPSIIPSQDSTVPSLSSTSFPLRQLPASACLYNQRETELVLI